ncbi:hypothetical protein Golomagni_03638 [Golovinomyces magnicellulatus]|nr:hypothetical protein Golomagni_03638 [Golovinomyces magnicellulatus]
MVETKNILTYPVGPDYQLVVGEGTYVLKEDLHFATPPPHPSELPVLNPNPLETAPQASTAGTKISLLYFDSQSSSSSFATDPTKSSRSGPLAESFEGNPNVIRSSDENTSGKRGDGVASATSSSKQVFSDDSAPAFGDGNSMLFGSSKDAGKKKKPKNNIAKSNSSFISRFMVNENLVRRLQERPSNGYFVFANINRAFQWLDLSSPQKVGCIKITLEKLT